MISQLSAYYLDKVYLDNNGEPVLSVSSKNNAEYMALTGNMFTSVQQFNLNANTTLYVLFENPIDSGVDVDLIYRFFQTDSDGADLVVTWNYDVTNGTKTALSTFNENNNYIGIKDSKSIVSVLNSITMNANTGIASVNSTFTPTLLGTIRETSFISESGTGNNQTGDIQPQTGNRIYKPGTGFLVKITSRGSNNQTLLGYTWNEREIK